MVKSNAKEWELIVEKVPIAGSLNMAIDDYLFQSLSSDHQTFLRFYRWERPTVSLGYSQDIRKVVDVNYCRKQGIDIVRRMTGGKLVLHHKEVTYSLCSSDEDTFTSIYILPTAEAFKQESYGTQASSYDNVLYIRLVTNIDCAGDELLWTKTRRKIIDAILNDSPIWSNIINRDLVSIAHDDYALQPKKSLEFLFEFIIREDCIV